MSRLQYRNPETPVGVTPARGAHSRLSGTNTGATLNLQLPEKTDLSSFDVIACGPGLTLDATDFARSVRE